MRMFRKFPKKQKTVMKIQRWEEKLFGAAVDQKDKVTNERFIEAQLVYYYQRMDTQDLITAGGISDIEDGYLLLSDLGLRPIYFQKRKKRNWDSTKFSLIKSSVNWRFGEILYQKI